MCVYVYIYAYTDLVWHPKKIALLGYTICKATWKPTLTPSEIIFQAKRNVVKSGFC